MLIGPLMLSMERFISEVLHQVILTLQQFKTRTKCYVLCIIRNKKSKYLAPKGHELCGSQVTNQSVVTILTYLCHLPQSIHRGFSTGLECALVSILLPSSPILINDTKPQIFKIKIFPHKARSRVLQEDVIPCRPPVPTRCELHIHLCSATCYSHLVRQVK